MHRTRIFTVSAALLFAAAPAFAAAKKAEPINDRKATPISDRKVAKPAARGPTKAEPISGGPTRAEPVNGLRQNRR